MADRVEEESLKRDIGLYGAFSMGYADVGADIYVALGLVALYAAGASPIAFSIAALTYICTGLAYAELATAYPYAGGAHVYAMKASRDILGFIAGWAVMLDYTVDISLFSLATSGYLTFFFPHLRDMSISIGGISIPYLGVISFAIVIFLMLINFIGIKESSKLNEFLVSINLVVLGLIMITGALLAFSLALFLSQIFIFGAPGKIFNVAYIFEANFQFQNFIYGITIAMASFIGIESIAQAAEETKKPYKWIPLANKLSILSVIVFAIGLSIISLGIVPWNVLAGSTESPVAVIAEAIPFIGGVLAPIVALTGFAICLVSTNTGVIGVSRVIYSMSRFKLFPKWFYKTHKKFKTPYRTILVFGLIGGALALVGELEIVAELYNFGALLSYLIVNICLIVLRNKEPEAYRAWKIPGDIKIKTKSRTIIIPIVSVIGTIMCGIIWGLIILFHPNGRILGTVWILIGLVGFVIYRVKNKLGVLSDVGSKEIMPSGYIMNATVLLRTPEDEEMIVSTISRGLDKRFVIKLLTILDPEFWGLPPNNVNTYKELEKVKNDVLTELSSIANRLRKKGYKCQVEVKIGNLKEIIDNEAKSLYTDAIVVIKKKSFKKDLKKFRDEENTIAEVLSNYPGKVLVLRREK
ncbi:MAG: APC family permease [Candidatus Odinarchaeia archaeon]